MSFGIDAMRKDQGLGKSAMLDVDKMVRSLDEASGKVSDHSNGLGGGLHQSWESLEETFMRDARVAILVEIEPERSEECLVAA